MSERDHAEIQALIGAFVLNATSPDERRRVDLHLASCADCAREARLLGEAAAELAWLPPREQSADVVDRVLASIPRRRRRLRTRVIAAVAAVSIAAAGLLGAALVRERNQNAELAAITGSASRRITLVPQKGFEGRGNVYVASDRVAVVLDRMPRAGRSRSYQLWAITGGKPVSMTVVEDSGRIVRTMRWDRPADAFAITIEPAGGSPVPTSDPVLRSQ